MYLSLKGSLGHTPITDRVGESLLQIAEGASAAYSLRNLGSDSPSVVRVRRESDNAERDFTAQDINTSVVENWVNQQIIPPLDLRELTPTGRDGPLIPAAAAYSLRSLGTNQWSYSGDTVTYTSDFSAGVDGWFIYHGSRSSVDDPVDTGKVLVFTVDTTLDQHWTYGGPVNQGNTYSISAQVYVPSSNAILDSIAIMDTSGGMSTNYNNITRDQWVNIPTSGTAVGTTLSIRGKSGTGFTFQGNGTDVYYIRNVVISETLGDSNYLPAGKYVTQVRRNSDNVVRSFTAVEVSNGTLLAWVNADVVTYTSDFSAGVNGWSADPASSATTTPNPVGAGDVLKYTIDTETTAKYLSRNALNVGQQYTVQAQVYVPSSNANLDSIVLMDGSGSMATSYLGIQRDEWVTVSTVGTASLGNINIRGASGTTASAYNGFQGNGTDVFYVRNVVVTQTTADGHVSTWYDQSGNTKHATQATAASQPKIVEGGVLVAGGIDFDGVNDYFQLDLGADLAQPNSFFMVHESDTTSELTNEFFDAGGTPRTLLDSAGTVYRMLAGVSGSSGLTIVANQKTLVGAFYDSTSSFLSKDGAVSSTFDVGTDAIDNLSNIGKSQARYYDGKMDEFIIYNSDQSANRTAFEANIGEVYGIAGIPAYDNTVNGFVETWYDQSGNGNNASQLTAANQPKIVDTGVLVLSNGNAAIKSTASNSMSFSMASLSADGQQSVFGVLENDVTSQNGFSAAIVALSNSDGSNGFNRRPYWFISPNGSLVFSADSLGGYINSDRDRRLYSHIMEDTAGGTSTVYQDGTQVDTRSITLDANPNFMFAQVGAVGTNAVGALYTSEIIYYPSDQSAKRAAIENNIDNHYGITSAGSYVNAAGDSYINAAGDTYLQP
jgi:hypothetical protein